MHIEPCENEKSDKSEFHSILISVSYDLCYTIMLIFKVEFKKMLKL